VEDVPVGYAVVIEHRRGDDVFAYARRWHEVEQLGVQLQHRRLGVARALLEHARRFAHSADVSVLGLSTHHFNEDARRAFGRCGFDATVVRMERAPSAWQPSGGRGSR
jgi:GNAT superfamily N-acetyltransferase